MQERWKSAAIPSLYLLPYSHYKRKFTPFHLLSLFYRMCNNASWNESFRFQLLIAPIATTVERYEIILWKIIVKYHNHWGWKPPDTAIPQSYETQYFQSALIAQKLFSSDLILNFVNYIISQLVDARCLILVISSLASTMLLWLDEELSVITQTANNRPFLNVRYSYAVSS